MICTYHSHITDPRRSKDLLLKLTHFRMTGKFEKSFYKEGSHEKIKMLPLLNSWTDIWNP